MRRGGCVQLQRISWEISVNLLQKRFPALTQALNDPSEWVRRNSVNALGTISEGTEALITALKDDHPLVRSNAVNALARTCKGTNEGIDAASRALSTVMYDDEYAIIREYAVAALEKINSQASN